MNEKRSTSIPPTVEERDDGPPRITGLGAVFYDKSDPGTEYKLFDDFVERIMPGAFDRAVEEDDIRSMFNHDPNILLGRKLSGTLEVAIEDRGLRYTATPSNARQSVVEDVRRGDVSGSSFMFQVTEVTWREVDDLLIREIEGVELFEVGPVVFPAYTGTTAEVKSLAGGLESLHNRLLMEARQHGVGAAGRKAMLLIYRRAKLRARKLGLTTPGRSA